MKDAHFAKDLQGRLDDEAQDIERVQLEIFEEALAAGGDDELGPDDIHIVDQDKEVEIGNDEVRGTCWRIYLPVQKMGMMDY